MIYYYTNIMYIRIFYELIYSVDDTNGTSN